MRYVQLRAFHHVAVCESFSKAAQMLHLTQPAISDQVRKLEYEYDVRLFDRSKKQITLTQHGHKLMELTHRMFEVEQQVLEYLTAEQSLRSGRLNIIADSTHHILHILGSFREKYPKIQVSIKAGNTASVIESLHSYTSDIGVLGVVPENREFDIAKLSSTPIVAFAPASNEISKLKSIKFEATHQTLAYLELFPKTGNLILQNSVPHRLLLSRRPVTRFQNLNRSNLVNWSSFPWCFANPDQKPAPN